MECPRTPRRGRPPGFDRAEALRRAMRVFWEMGYEAATLAQLKAAMGGLCAPSVYAAFGSKEQLFRAALELYESETCQWGGAALALPTAREAVAVLLREAALRYTTPGLPAGCLVDLATANFSPASAAVRDALRERRQRGEAALRARLDAAVSAGELPPGTDTAGMAAFYRTVLMGLSIQAVDGTPRETLLAIGEAAMATWARWAAPAGATA
ncbi:TetR/AcrR family transcriptional regulator [Roseomonas sp. GC11]|uniref:TetR/AcrR family transcriptional regulator n=1 Tax=Roseomonas sp. GC11 TaxID=2950546 RepID=UPI0021090F5B|nr:TetR/AcrR family transcriptional regulator [Roseomonas sp. GC11]